MLVSNIFTQKYSELQIATNTLKGFFKCHKKYLLMAQSQAQFVLLSDSGLEDFEFESSSKKILKATYI